MTVPYPYRIKLNWVSFNLDWSDWVEIRDGGYANSSLLWKYSGNAIPGEFVSNGNQQYLRFVTDEKKRHSGFELYLTFQTCE